MTKQTPIVVSPRRLWSLCTFVPTLFIVLLSTNKVDSVAPSCATSTNDGRQIQGGVEEDMIVQLQEQLLFERALRSKIAGQLEAYACQDSTLTTSESIYNSTWDIIVGRQKQSIQHESLPPSTRSVPVKVLHQQASSRIHALDHFLSEDECDVLLEYANDDLLRPATVGGGVQWKVRRAQQANIPVNKAGAEEHSAAVISDLSQRVYDYTNHVFDQKFLLQSEGQASLKLIQYIGRGQNETHPDFYAPHCDAPCDGQSHRVGDRIATMIMYCQIPDEGGHTHFQNAGVHYQPRNRGDALFFSYVDPDTMTMDDGYTVHSGCPVLKGTKTIITQWVRYGVNANRSYQSLRQSLGY